MSAAVRDARLNSGLCESDMAFDIGPLTDTLGYVRFSAERYEPSTRISEHDTTCSLSSTATDSSLHPANCVNLLFTRFQLQLCFTVEKVSKEDIAWLKWKKALEGHGVTVRKEEEKDQSTVYNLGGF